MDGWVRDRKSVINLAGASSDLGASLNGRSVA